MTTTEIITETSKQTIAELKLQGLIVGTNPFLRMSDICVELGKGKNWVIERIECVKIRTDGRTICTPDDLNIPRPIPVLHLPNGYEISKKALEKWRAEYEDHNRR